MKIMTKKNIARKAKRTIGAFMMTFGTLILIYGMDIMESTEKDLREKMMKGY